MTTAIFAAAVVLLLTLAVWVAYFLDLGIFDKIRNALLGTRMAVATVASIYVLAVVLYAIFGSST